MYEWEQKVDQTAVESRKHWLQQEIKRISNVTLRQTFSNPEDYEYWAKRLQKLNGELRAIEELLS